MHADDAYLQLEYYYPVVDNDAGIDVNGDAVILGLVAPLLATLRADGAVARGEFMRYSVGGYHIRLKLRGEQARLEQARTQLIEPLLQRFSRDHAADFAAAMALGDYSRQLYQRLELDPAQLRQGGEYRLAFARDLDGLYEDAEVFRDYVEFSELLCDCLIQALALLDEVKPRKTLARLLLADLLGAAGLGDDELYYVLFFIKRQWEAYFQVDAARIAECARSSAQLAPRFHAFLRSKDGIAASALALPPAAQALYRTQAAQLAALMPRLIRQAPQGGMGNNTALRLLSLVHLTHNRLGLDITQELLFTDMLSAYYGARLGQDSLADSRHWVERNLSEYLSRRENLVY